MSFLSQSRTKRLLAVHGWSGTVLGLLLYVCIFTGAIVVFEREIAQWSRGLLAQEEGIGSRVDHHFRSAARDVDRRLYDQISVARLSSGKMRYVFEGDELDPETGETNHAMLIKIVDQETGELVHLWREGVGVFPDDPGNALRDFWIALHVQLYLPNPYGLILVGVLGLMMMAASVSGVLIHRHLFRDAFVAVRDRKRLVGARDLHVLAGTWGLPFAFILAFTGAFFGFATTVGVPMMALSVFDGDEEAMIETVLGREDEPDLTPFPTASLDYIIASAEQLTGGTASFILIKHYDSVSTQVLVSVTQAPRALADVVLRYDGVTRVFEGIEPAFGRAPSLGASLYSMIEPLHFGDFAGLASKTVWFCMGLAMAFVTATGMLLWTKRRQDQALWRRFNQAVIVTIWGLPLAMLVSAAGYFIARPFGDPHFWTPFSFLLGAFFAIVLGLRSGDAEPLLRRAVTMLCIAMPVLRHVTGGTSWSEALTEGGGAILVIDLLLISIGALFWHRARDHDLKQPATSIHEAAE